MESDLLHECILRIENNVKTLREMNYKKGRTQPKRLFSDESTSDATLPSKPTTTRSFSRSTSRRSPPQHTGYYKGPDMEYLRKNANMTCADQDQILESYIKLRLAIAKGGIFIKPIEEINKQDTIAQHMPGGNGEDQDIQSNALFTLLSNEKNSYQMILLWLKFVFYLLSQRWMDLGHSRLYTS